MPSRAAMSSSRTPGTRPTMRPRRSASSQSGSSSRIRASAAEFVAAGERATFDGPYILGVGTLEPRKNLHRLVEAWRRLGAVAPARARRRRRVGRAAGPRRRRHRPSRLRPGRARCPRSIAGPTYTSTRRCSRASGSPSSRRWRVARRWSSRTIRRSTRRAARLRVRVDPHDPESIAAGISEALARRDELVPRRDRARRAVHLARDGRDDARRVRRARAAAMKVGDRRLARSCRPVPGRRATCGAFSPRSQGGPGSSCAG